MQIGKLFSIKHGIFQSCISKDVLSPAVLSFEIKSLEARSEAQNNMRSPMNISHKTVHVFSIRNIQVFIKVLRDEYCCAREQV